MASMASSSRKTREYVQQYPAQWHRVSRCGMRTAETAAAGEKTKENESRRRGEQRKTEARNA